MKCVSLNELKKIFYAEQERISKACEEFPWENEAAYISWIVNSYQYATQGTKILAAAAALFPDDKSFFTHRFISHAAEEKGHERLFENDMREFGLDVKTISPLTIGKAFHQSVYYWLWQREPMGIFGIIFALEGTAVLSGPKIYKRCVSAYGFKKTSFLKVHAEEDPDHLESAFNIAEKFTNSEFQFVADAIQFQSELYVTYLNTIAKAALSSNQSIAA